ncbi:MAG: serine/threonine-protein kinase [Vicinamibacterales bacterium]
MTPERWQQVQAIFHAALEQPASAREAYLSTVAADDAELSREVRSLLATHDSSPDFLEKPAYQVAASLILDEPSLTGRQIGNYEVLEEIGRGGMGIVYVARDANLDRLVALKALPPEYTSDITRRERLRREGKAAAKLSHPAIATVFDLTEVDGQLFLISELVRGENLREELKRGPLQPARLLDTLVDIASGLAAAHEAGVVHRDLKPDNIIRCADGHVKILDFGLARLPNTNAHTTAQLTEVSTSPGTPGYMSPEQLHGHEVDARTDIFAFGIVGWELATGRHPLGADNLELLANLAELMEGRGAGRFTQPLSVPGLSVVLRRCLRVSPAERYSSGGALLPDLRALRLDRDSGSAVIQQPSSALWWWQFHQVTVAIVNGFTPVAAWFVRRWAGPPYGSIAFFAVLALATISVTLRLNLLFISRIHPATLPRHRSRLYTSIATAEAVLALVLLGSAALVAGPYDGMAAILVTLAVVTIASLGIIEPATTSAAGLTDGD